MDWLYKVRKFRDARNKFSCFSFAAEEKRIRKMKTLSKTPIHLLRRKRLIAPPNPKPITAP